MNAAYLHSTVNPPGREEKFSLPRFNRLTGRYLQAEGRTLLLTLLLVLGVLIVFFILNTFGEPYASWPASNATDPAWSGEMLIAQAVFYMFAACCGAMMFSGMSTREERLALLTLPGSMTEKFMMRVIIYVPCAIAAFLVCVWLADAVRCLTVVSFADHAPGSVKLIPVEQILTFGNPMPAPRYGYAGASPDIIEAGRLRSIGYIITDWSIVLVIGALYAMGSLLFPRKALIKTTAWLFLLICVIGMLWWASMSIFGLSDGAPEVSAPTISSLVTRGTVTGGIVILLYCWCYARFCEEEVTERW